VSLRQNGVGPEKNCADAALPKGHNQHNQAVAKGLKVKTNVKAGDKDPWPDPPSTPPPVPNHNQTMAQGLNMKTGVKASESNGEIHIGY
jgi:hypothetical protein